MANTRRFTDGLPGEVRDLMAGLGANLRIARKRRKMSVAALAERLMVSAPTVRKLEAGQPTVSLGVLATALWVLGLSHQFTSLAAPEADEAGLRAELRRLAGQRKRGAGDDLDF